MADAEAARAVAAAAVRLAAVPPPMVDIEAAAVRAAAEAVPPQAPAPAARRTADTAHTLANAVIYCCLGVMWVSNAAAFIVVLARYAVGRAAHAALVVYVARVLFLGALPVAGLLCLCSVLVLLARMAGQQAEPPEHLLLVEGVYVTAQIHGSERPAARGLRGGGGYSLVPLLIFVFFWMDVLVVLLLQDRSPASSCWEDSMAKPALISDMGTFAGSGTVMFLFIPYVFVQVRDAPNRATARLL